MDDILSPASEASDFATPAAFFPRARLVIEGRQRSQIDPASLAELADSLRKPAGLLHAPTGRWKETAEGRRLVLVGGERRVRALDLLFAEGIPVSYADAPIPPGTVPIVVLDLDDVDAHEAELDENLKRLELPWADRIRALAGLHALRKSENPSQTFKETAREVKEATQASPSKMADWALRTEIQRAVAVAPLLDDPAISSARTAHEAHKLVLKRQIEAVEAERHRRRAERMARPSAAGVAPPPPLIELVCGDAFELMPTLPPSTYDLILTDPPYGISVGGGGFRDRTMHHHNYEDSPEAAAAAMELLFSEGWRVSKTRANLITFIDVRNFVPFRDMGTRYGWDVWSFPLIWIKGNEGLLPGFAGGRGPRHCYEALLYATKGRRGLNSHLIDAFIEPRVSRKDRIYGAQKPIRLISRLLEEASSPDDSVLDPFMGAGTTLRAARLGKRRGLGIELDPTVHVTATAYVFADESKLDEVADRFSAPADVEEGGVDSPGDGPAD